MRTKIRHVLISLIAFSLAVFLGIFVALICNKFIVYSRVPGIAIQGKSILDEVNKYHLEFGVYPDQSWFEGLGEKRISSEGRVWFYRKPKQVKKDTVIIYCAISDENAYLAGYGRGHVIVADIEDIAYLESSPK